MNKNLNTMAAAKKLFAELGLVIGKNYRVTNNRGTEVFRVLGFVKSYQEIEVRVESLIFSKSKVEYHMAPWYWRCIKVSSFDAWNYDTHWEEAQFYERTDDEDYNKYVEYTKNSIKSKLGNIEEISDNKYELYVGAVRALQGILKSIK